MPLAGGPDDCGESRDCSPTITWPRSKRQAMGDDEEEEEEEREEGPGGGGALSEGRDTLWDPSWRESPATAFSVSECNTVRPKDYKGWILRLCFQDCWRPPGSAFIHSLFDSRTNYLLYLKLLIFRVPFTVVYNLQRIWSQKIFVALECSPNLIAGVRLWFLLLLLLLIFSFFIYSSQVVLFLQDEGLISVPVADMSQVKYKEYLFLVQNSQRLQAAELHMCSNGFNTKAAAGWRAKAAEWWPGKLTLLSFVHTMLDRVLLSVEC